VPSIKCARCKGKHANAQEVRACFNTPLPARTVPADGLKKGGLTDRQKSYIQQLLVQKGAELPGDVEDLTKQEASATIDRLRVLPNVPEEKQMPLPGVTVEEGMYRDPNTGEIFKVQKAIHGSGNLYAKKLVFVRQAEYDDEGDLVMPGAIRFDYIPGLLKRLKPSMRMTLEQAKEFGALYGTCVRCGRTLTKEKSIERAMGPVCAGKI